MRVKMKKTEKYMLKKIRNNKTSTFKWERWKNICEFFTLSMGEELIFTKETTNSNYKNQNTKITVETKKKVIGISINAIGIKIDTEDKSFFFVPIEHKPETKEKPKAEDLEALDALDVK